jgi:hypothetical protein
MIGESEVILMIQLPAPYKGETFYSVIARYTALVGNINHKYAVEDLYNISSRRSNMKFIFDIDALTNNIKNDISSSTILYKHTAFPFYAAYLPGNRVERIEEAFIKGKSKGILNSLGITSNSVRTMHQFKHCRSCIRSDLKSLGETFWQIVHQIDGVFSCPVHQEPLIYIESVNLNQQQYIRASEDLIYSGKEYRLNSITESKVNLISKEVNWLLENKIKFSNPDYYRNAYICLLQESNLAYKSQRVKQRALKELYENTYDKKLQELMQCDIGNSVNDNWLCSIVRKHRKSFHPIRHIMFTLMLNTSLQSFYERELQVTRNEEKLVVISPKVESEIMNKKKKEWMKLIGLNPECSVTELRKINPALYTWLYRNDVEWLRINSPKIKKRVRKSNIDWAERDEILSREINAIINSWGNYEKYKVIKITNSSIAKRTKRKHLVDKKLDRLPKSSNLLRRKIETNEQFRKRRIDRVISDLIKRNDKLSFWIVVKMAGIRKEYLTEKMKEYIFEKLDVEERRNA